MKNSEDERQNVRALWMAAAGWVIAFVTALAVSDWHVVDALTSWPLVSISVLVFVTFVVVAKRRES